MDRSTPIYLISETKQQNGIKEWKAVETKRKVFANVKSVTSTEFFSAGQIGLSPEFRFTMFGPDYAGERIVEYNGVRYAVYRVYQATTDTMELYVQKEVGVS
jgi:SPP1 family predicted phage head-tail adaptor